MFRTQLCCSDPLSAEAHRLREFDVAGIAIVLTRQATEMVIKLPPGDIGATRAVAASIAHSSATTEDFPHARDDEEPQEAESQTEHRKLNRVYEQRCLVRTSYFVTFASLPSNGRV